MLENTKEHLYMNLATIPDRFILISTSENVQGIFEITGGSPLPNRFFAHYGYETELTSIIGRSLLFKHLALLNWKLELLSAVFVIKSKKKGMAYVLVLQ
ncbi:hypothetical protein A5809_000894 [Enterococcus faecium]|nr:hypothetical protein A5809_000894 [Enterococcus faecium]